MGNTKIMLKNFLLRSKIPIDIEDNKKYKRVTIRTKHQGVSVRDIEIGSKIGTKKQFILKSGQFVLSKIDAMYGAFGIAPDEVEDSVITGNFWAYDYDQNKVSIEWLNHFTNSPDFYDLCRRASTGITHRKYLDEDFFLSYEVTLPSLKEQKEIVGIIDSLRFKVDNLNRSFNYQLIKLENLNQAILQEAVQGKLVKQDPKDEPANELLKRIKAEKLKFGKKGKLSSPIQPNDIPFEIPESWEWCRLEEICSKIGSGSTPTGSDYSKGGIPFFRSQNIYNEGLIYDDIKFISEQVQKQMNGTTVLANDILLNITGGSMGRSALVPDDFEKGNVSQHVCIIRSSMLNSNYFHKIILSPYFQKLIFSSTTGAGREGLPKYNLEKFVIPVPPLSEQKRIVVEIEKQFAKTKKLKEHIISNQQATEQLLKALLHQAFEINNVEEKEVKQSKIVDIKPSINLDTLAASPFENYVPLFANNIQDFNWELAMMVSYIEKRLGVSYGDVGMQKNVFNASVKEPILSKSYNFINSNFGTYSYALKDDLNNNPYLIKKNVKGKEVYAVNTKYQKAIVDKLSSPENKGFVQTLDTLLSIYEHPFINKETDKIELFNTVLKVALDKNSIDIEVIYQEMKDWKINQEKFKAKAEKFSKSETEQMLKLLIEKKVLDV